eukprot:g11844.t1
MDARSTGAFGPIPEQLFSWNSNKFGRLLAYHNNSIDQGGGVPTDTLFDSFLFNAYDWYDHKSMWPGVGSAPMNVTDWLGYLDLILDMGSDSLELAAKNMSMLLPLTSSSKLRPSLVFGIPYPDPRQEDFGIVNSIDPTRSLNFSINQDRIDAVNWWTNLAYNKVINKKYEYIDFKGFYWFLEEVLKNDPVLLQSVSSAIHNFGKPGSLMLVWIPYYRPGDPHTGEWKELGFDFATLQPNYAFGNVTAKKRFPAIRSLCDQYELGIELELPYHIRNDEAGGWMGNFHTYLQEISNWEKESNINIMKTYYYGNIFVEEYSGNKTNFPYYQSLYRFVKGI